MLRLRPHATLRRWLLAGLAWAALSPAVPAAQIPVIDAHSQLADEVAPEQVIRLMNQAGVAHTILAARGRTTPEALIAFARRHPARITPAVRTEGRAYAGDAPEYYRELERQLKMPEFGAIAEVLMWQAAKGRLAPQIVVAPDDRRVQVALGATIERGWPFIAHIEFAAAGADREPFMAKFRAMLAANPSIPFLLIHMGQIGPAEVRTLIEAHSNLLFLTSSANPVAAARSGQPWTNMFAGEHLAAEWKELMIDFPENFVLAFDNTAPEHWGEPYLRQTALWRKALAELPTEVAHAVAHGNAELLWGLPPAR
ncbi:MAG: hypothetical protein HY521_02040 [Proteobacteria bacterium]|nr:hypothetical protein [Pseudomonadota bacterium]